MVKGSNFSPRITEDKKIKEKKKRRKGKKKSGHFKINHQCFSQAPPLSSEGNSPIWDASMFAKALNSLNSGNWSSEVISSVKQKILMCPWCVLDNTLHLYGLLKISVIDSGLLFFLFSVSPARVTREQENDGSIYKLLQAPWA